MPPIPTHRQRPGSPQAPTTASRQASRDRSRRGLHRRRFGLFARRPRGVGRILRVRCWLVSGPLGTSARPSLVNVPSTSQPRDGCSPFSRLVHRTRVRRKSGKKTRAPALHPCQVHPFGRRAILANTGRSSSCTRRNGRTWPSVLGDTGRSRSTQPPPSLEHAQHDGASNRAPLAGTADLATPPMCLERGTGPLPPSATSARGGATVVDEESRLTPRGGS
jgi:hypothetical protein